MEQVNSMEFIDLGLPSGIKWAKTNLGAEKETDYGDYFMWGATTPSTAEECKWKNVPFNNGSISCDEEYFNTHKSEWLDDKDNLKFEYDAAYKATDGIARMPTNDEFQELLDNTDNIWIKDYNGTGVKGVKFTSKIDESKYIFIPAAGICGDGSVYGVGGGGNVWSSSLYTSVLIRAWDLGFDSGFCGMGNCNSSSGRSIRPVMD